MIKAEDRLELKNCGDRHGGTAMVAQHCDDRYGGMASREGTSQDAFSRESEDEPLTQQN